MLMKTYSYRMTFLTPAFLGNAEQSAQWRTPPIKALLRQWWRMHWAAMQSGALDVDRMREAEGKLFGAAASGEGTRSRVRIRLDRWSEGRMTTWPKDPAVAHPEVHHPVGAHLYLGFGPLGISNRATAIGKKEGPNFKPRAAIQAGENALIRIAVPDEHSEAIENTVALIDAFGTIGGRSRNGWGSISVEPLERTPELRLPCYERPWKETMDADWPSAIGTDEHGPLVWRTQPFQDWASLMKQLAELRISLRTRFRFTTGKKAPAPEARHWLAYPVTHHDIRSWGNLRLPNSLRFKVRPSPDGGLVGLVFHVPCMPPKGFQPDRATILRLWEQVHGALDDMAPALIRLEG